MKKVLLLSFLALFLFVCVGVESVYAEETFEPSISGMEIGPGYDDCRSLLGSGLTTVVRWIRIGMQIAGISICVISGMISFMGAVASKNADSLNAAFRKFAILLVICAALLLLPTLISILGNLIDMPLNCF